MFDLALPKTTLGLFPTPIQRLTRLGRLLGHDRLYIKRDDLSGLGLGGNKTRSLEFLMADALVKKADTIITSGGLQSNLCALTAAACARLGLGCYLVHNDTKPETEQGNMLLNRLFGAESVFLGAMDETKRASEASALAARLREDRLSPYIIENGASVPIGALGYAEAAKEIYAQSTSQSLDIKHVFIVGAMGGTASGMVYGAWLLGAPFHVHVISVEYRKAHLRELMQDLLQGMIDLTGLCPKIPLDSVMTIHDRYLGKGYAIATEESRGFLYRVPRYEGILLEDVYTAKTFSGMADLIESNAIAHDEACCYVHTGGLGSLFAQNI